jgi:outer membrane lipoprotein-sorting protein
MSTEVSAQPLGEAETQVFLETMRQALAPIRTLQAEFVQERRVSMFVDTLVTTGVCLFEPPRRLRWELTAPYVSVLVHSAEGVSKFDEEEGHLRKMNLGGEEILTQVLGQVVDWMRGDFARAREAYVMEVRPAGTSRLLTLRPRSEKLRQMLLAIELTVNPENYHVTQVTIRETSEDSVQIRFVREKINEAIPENAFDLKKPLWPLPKIF